MIGPSSQELGFPEARFWAMQLSVNDDAKDPIANYLLCLASRSFAIPLTQQSPASQVFASKFQDYLQSDVSLGRLAPFNWEAYKLFLTETLDWRLPAIAAKPTAKIFTFSHPQVNQLTIQQSNPRASRQKP
jgi:hypothetical protein